MSARDTCIFCLEGPSPPQHGLLYNVKCRCNFAFHKQCYDAYTRKTICPVCRAEVGEFFTLDIEELPQSYQNYQTIPSQPPQSRPPQPQNPLTQPNQLPSRCNTSNVMSVLIVVLVLVIFLIIMIETLKRL